jgi:hypothetical protein
MAATLVKTYSLPLNLDVLMNRWLEDFAYRIKINGAAAIIWLFHTAISTC